MIGEIISFGINNIEKPDVIKEKTKTFVSLTHIALF